MKKTILLIIIAILAITFVNCASKEVKLEPVVEEPKPSKKPALNEALEQRSRDIK